MKEITFDNFQTHLSQILETVEINIQIIYEIR